VAAGADLVSLFEKIVTTTTTGGGKQLKNHRPDAVCKRIRGSERIRL
jgi:hypothetical protein